MRPYLFRRVQVHAPHFSAVVEAEDKHFVCRAVQVEPGGVRRLCALAEACVLTLCAPAATGPLERHQAEKSQRLPPRQVVSEEQGHPGPVLTVRTVPIVLYTRQGSREQAGKAGREARAAHLRGLRHCNASSLDGRRAAGLSSSRRCAGLCSALLRRHQSHAPDTLNIILLSGCCLSLATVVGRRAILHFGLGPCFYRRCS